MDDTRKIDPH